MRERKGEMLNEGMREEDEIAKGAVREGLRSERRKEVKRIGMSIIRNDIN